MQTLHTCPPTVPVTGPNARLTVRLITRPIADLIAAWRRQRLHQATVEALHSLDERTLHDLGFHRSEIGGVAAEIGGRAETTYVRVQLAHRLRA